MKSKEEIIKEIEDSTYVVRVTCTNCDKSDSSFRIPVGILVKDCNCPYCRCNTLIKIII